MKVKFSRDKSDGPVRLEVMAEDDRDRLALEAVLGPGTPTLTVQILRRRQSSGDDLLGPTGLVVFAEPPKEAAKEPAP